MTTLPTRVTVKPGMLVTLSTKIRGGRSYEREDLSDQVTETGAEVEEWRTVKVTEDPAEYEQATRVRSRVRSLFKSATVATPFGMICPSEDLEALDAAQAEADRLVSEFNADAQTCEVHYASLRGEIAESTREAIRAIREETGELLRSLDEASRAGEVQSIRDIASRAKQMSRLLEDESEGRDAVSQAINAARKVARDVVRRVQKSGEQLEEVLHESNLSPISQARFLFMEQDQPVGETDADRPMLAMPEPEVTEADPLPDDEPARYRHVMVPGDRVETVPIGENEGDPHPDDDSPLPVDSGRFAGLFDPDDQDDQEPA